MISFQSFSPDNFNKMDLDVKAANHFLVTHKHIGPINIIILGPSFEANIELKYAASDRVSYKSYVDSNYWSYYQWHRNPQYCIPKSLGTGIQGNSTIAMRYSERVLFGTLITGCELGTYCTTNFITSPDVSAEATICESTIAIYFPSYCTTCL